MSAERLFSIEPFIISGPPKLDQLARKRQEKRNNTLPSDEDLDICGAFDCVGPGRAAVLSLVKRLPAKTGLTLFELKDVPLDISRYETEEIGLRRERFENGVLYLVAYDKLAEHEETARIFDTFPILEELTPEQCKLVVRNSKILLDQQQTAA